MKIVYFLISIFIFHYADAQVDSLQNYNYKKEYTQKFVDSIISDMSMPVKMQAFKQVLNSNSKLVGWHRYYVGKSSVSFREKKYDSTIIYADMATKAYEEISEKREIDEKLLLNVYLNEGAAFYFLEDYQKSIISYQKSLELTKKHPYKWKSFIATGIANSHLELGNDSLALKSYLQADKDTLYMKIDRSAVTTKTRIGVLYDKFGKRDLAKSYYLAALKRSEESNYKANMSSLLGNLGSLHFYNKDNDSVYYYYKKALKINKINGVGSYRGANDNNKFYKSFVDIYEGKIANGVSHLEELVESISNLDKITKEDKALFEKSADLLGVSYKRQNDFTKYQGIMQAAFKVFNKFHDSQVKEGLQNLEIRYQTRQKDASIAQLEENEQQQGKIIEQQRIITFGLGGLLLLLSGLGYLFWRQRKLKNQYEKENLEQRLLRSQMNPHFVSNALNTVCALVEKKSDNTIPYVNKLAGLFRLTLENSREEFIGLDEEVAAIRNYLDLQSNLSDAFNYTITIDESINQEETIVPPMLIQPFVENAIIHGIKQKEGKGEIRILISKDQKAKLLQCKISDNGVGYTESITNKLRDNHKSVSGSIVRERLAILKKKFKVNTRFSIKNLTENEGTLVELYLPFFLE